jgi:hypothetical protein
MMPLFPLSAFVDLWLCRFGVGGACQSDLKGTPTTDSLIAARSDSFRVYNHNYSVHTYSIIDVQTRRRDKCHV